MRRALRLGPVILLAACGYFNSLYNAQRRFDDALRAEQRGDVSEATIAYNEAIEKAAISYRGHPDGRWADDALFLLGRARFGLHQYDAARAAFMTLLLERPDFEARADAQAWLGASEVALGNRLTGIAHLDSAIASGPSAQAASLAHLWRARGAFDADAAGPTAWADLDAASTGNGYASSRARLELAHRAIQAGDTTRVRIAYDRLFADRTAAMHSDSIAVLTTLAGAADPDFARSILEPVAHSDWPAAAREVHLLERARLAAAAGDTVLAIADALELAGRATAATAGRARTLAARYQLARTADVAGLTTVRATLLPAVEQPEARRIIRTIKAVEILLERAGAGQPLAFFAAAEWLRDDLGAPLLARQLFVAYADVVPAAVWAPKALLAALALSTDDTTRRSIADRIAGSSDNVYALAVFSRTDAAEFETAEQRLSRSLTALREGAMVEADARDIRVGVAVARIDSLRATAMADSMRLACGNVVDSLAISGIRADSLLVACMRSDTARMNAVLRADTTALRDTSFAARNRARAGIDTSASHRPPAGTDPFGPLPR